MKQNGKYRFSLQFSDATEANVRAGELLEHSGNKKSALIVDALNEYIDNHPDNGDSRKQINREILPFSDRAELEKMIRDLIEERLGREERDRPFETAETVPENDREEEIENDVSQMLDNLDFFDV